MVKKILFSAISAILVSSCASQENVKTESVPVVTATCETRVRNLTLPWSADTNSCSENRDPAEIQAKTVQRQLERNAMLAEKRQLREMNFVEMESHSAVSLPMSSQEVSESIAEPEALSAGPVSLPVNIIEPDDNISSLSSTDDESSDVVIDSDITNSSSVEQDDSVFNDRVDNADDANIKIWFAENIHVLGPEGLRSVLDLDTDIQGAGRIKLRGVILPHEAKGSDLEVFSVARALAVKRALIREVRIDPDRITILHYSPNYQGRYVEVILNG